MTSEIVTAIFIMLYRRRVVDQAPVVPALEIRTPVVSNDKQQYVSVLKYLRDV